MIITARLFATLREGRGKEIEIEIPEPVTFRDVLAKLDIDEADAAIKLINGRHSENDSPIKEGDVVSIFPPVGGG